jgi:hypothetical protein
MPSSGVCLRVDVVDWTDVSEDRIASIFRVEKSASEEPAWAGSCRTDSQSKTPSYIWAGGESGHKGIIKKRGGRVCGGQQVAGENLYRIGRGEIQGYGVSIDPLALVLFLTGAWPLSLVDLASCSGCFLREQMRGFHELLRHKPISLFTLFGWSSISIVSLTMRSM